MFTFFICRYAGKVIQLQPLATVSRFSCCINRLTATSPSVHSVHFALLAISETVTTNTINSYTFLQSSNAFSAYGASSENSNSQMTLVSIKTHDDQNFRLDKVGGYNQSKSIVKC